MQCNGSVLMSTGGVLSMFTRIGSVLINYRLRCSRFQPVAWISKLRHEHACACTVDKLVSHIVSHEGVKAQDAVFTH